jgi:serine/threonine protein kinase
MDKYNIIKQVGDGSYGTVYKAVEKRTAKIVAIKKMKIE